MSQKTELEADNATFMATTPGPSVQEEILENETCKKILKRKTKGPSVQESVQLLQVTVENLQKQVSLLSMQHERSTFSEDSLLENKLVKLAQTRLRFDVKDVHGCIKTWDLFFRLYGAESDFEKFFAVQQLLPMHIQKAMSTNGDLQRSYKWLISYLTSRYEQRFMCHELCNRSITKSTNLNEVEDWATEAANCSKEHLIKHFMLEACSYHQRQKMKPYLLLSVNEFKLKLRSVVQEDTRRFSANRCENADNNRINAIEAEVPISNEGTLKETDHPQSSSFREFRRSPPSTQGNGKA